MPRHRSGKSLKSTTARRGCYCQRFQREPEITRGLKPLLRLFLQTAPHDAHKLRWEFAVLFGELLRFVFQDGAHRLAYRRGPKCLLPRKQLVKQRAEGEDVRAVIDFQPANLFRRHVLDRKSTRLNSSHITI